MEEARTQFVRALQDDYKQESKFTLEIIEELAMFLLVNRDYIGGVALFCVPKEGTILVDPTNNKPCPVYSRVRASSDAEACHARYLVREFLEQE